MQVSVCVCVCVCVCVGGGGGSNTKTGKFILKIKIFCEDNFQNLLKSNEGF